MSIFGIYGVSNAAQMIYLGLHALQHRGQEGAGIATFDKNGNCCHHKGLGLVSEVFTADRLEKFSGNIGIGSTQYANAAKGGLDNVQPLYFRHKSGDLVIAGEGSLVNAEQISSYLESNGCLFQTFTDAEILANLIKKEKTEDRISRLVNAFNMMEGGFAFAILTRNRIYAARDKYGIKPLALAKLNGGWVISSETCAFELIGAEYVRDVEPGEIISIDDEHGLRSSRYSRFQKHKVCSMEYIYIARPDSNIDGRNVHAFRQEVGRRLADECPADADIVVGVPDSGLSAALGYAERSGIPYELGLVKNRYIARTFIQPSQEMRERGVQMKLSAVRSLVNGKRLVLVDDSIVRGTTCLKIVKMLRAAGAKEVHVRIASPMMTHPCFYGVDTSTPEEILCSTRGIEEACRMIQADSLGYVSRESTVAATCGCSELCLACFGGGYPTALYQHEKTKE